jgi:hypothetical protein
MALLQKAAGVRDFVLAARAASASPASSKGKAGGPHAAVSPSARKALLAAVCDGLKPDEQHICKVLVLALLGTTGAIDAKARTKAQVRAP